MRTVLPALAFSLVLAAAAGCKVATPSDNKVEDFTATLAPAGSRVHIFNMAKDGEFSIKMTAINPAVVVGVGYGQPYTDGSCGVYSSVTTTVGRQAFASYAYSGTYCTVIFDPGSFTQNVTYTVQVSHP